MRDFEKPGRSDALGTRGMVATSHPKATLAAVTALQDGGNAVDAAIIAAAVLGVVEPTQTGIGGDCFVLLKQPRKPIVALDGSGWAPARAVTEFYLEQKIANISYDSPHAVTVPGAVRAWAMLAKDYGSFEWERLFQPAIDAAENGCPVTERVARDWARQVDKLRKVPECAEVFLFSGKPPKAGTIHRQPTLARALKSIAAEGEGPFYEGWIAEDLLTVLQTRGGLHERADFAEYHPRYVTPIATQYRDYELWECPPSGQGIIALAMASVLEKFDLGCYPPLSAERFHLFAEVARLAYAERDLFLCDPTFHSVPVEYLLSNTRSSDLARRINFEQRLETLMPTSAPTHHDTTYISVVDERGTAVSFINSIFDDFGSGLLGPRSGVLLHNRGCGFVVEEGHPNTISGRKRPMHTIIPALLTLKGEAVMPFGVTGAHFQPLGQIQVLTNIVDYGMSIQEAIDHPRMFARGNDFEVESTVPETIVRALQAKGHRPTRAINPLGTAQAIWIDHAAGVLRGGADPRRDGIAIGY